MMQFVSTRLLCLCLVLFSSLSTCAPLTATLLKRNSALYDLWNGVSGQQKVGGDSATFFDIDYSESSSWGITYMYGCAGIIISDISQKALVLGHLQQEGNTGCISLNDRTSTNYWIEKLRLATDLFDPTASTTVDLLYDDSQANSQGLQSIRSFLTQDWEFEGTIGSRSYIGGSGTGTPDQNSPRGLAVIQWILGEPGTLNIFFNKEDALRSITH